MTFLYMLVLGCKPPGRHTEQHDTFFTIGNELKDLVPAIREFWPEADAKVHIDAFRRVTKVGDFGVAVTDRQPTASAQPLHLYFVNLGGYKPNEMEEYHYKQLVVAESLGDAIRQSKETTFWKHHTSSHVDDKYALDVDDIYDVEDLLPSEFKEKYQLSIQRIAGAAEEDPIENGYFKLSAL